MPYARIRAFFADSSTSFVLWIPVFIAAGIGCFFLSGGVPPLYVFAILSVLLFAGAAIGWLLRGRLWSQPCGYLLLAIMLMILGALAAHIRVAVLATPILARDMPHVIVHGIVEKIVRYEDGGQHLYIRSPAFSSHKGDTYQSGLEALRIRVRPQWIRDELRIGDKVRLAAGLHSLPAPSMPGGYDYARALWFSGVGGVGYAKAPIEIMASAPNHNFRPRLYQWRLDISARLLAQAGGSTAGTVMVALLTGLRGEIPQYVVTDLRHAGLAHLLAISGLHMGLMVGAIFFASRAAMAALPSLALTLHIKKVAAIVAMAGGLAYLLVSGASLPTVRAFIMAGIVLCAVVLDRRAMTLRLVAVAATVILLIWPESILSVSFQMSFAAVTALIAIYSQFERRMKSWWLGRGWGDKLAFYVLAVLGTTIVAEMALAPITLYHFNILAHYGLLANAIAMPIMVFWVMPCLLMLCLLYPLQMEGVIIPILKFGIEIIISTASWVAGLPGATGVYESPSFITFLIIIFAGLWLCLWRGKARYLGCVVALTVLALLPKKHASDILIGTKGTLYAVRDGTGALEFSPQAARQKRVVRDWVRKAGQEEPAQLVHNNGYRCDNLGCIMNVKGVSVAFTSEMDGMVEDCAKTAVVIASFYVPKELCQQPQLVLGLNDFRQNGSYALWITHTPKGPYHIEWKTVKDTRGDWPWANHRY